MRVRFLDADDVRIRFEAACTRLGEGEARRAFSMALNKEGRKSFTQLREHLTTTDEFCRRLSKPRVITLHEEVVS